MKKYAFLLGLGIIMALTACQTSALSIVGKVKSSGNLTAGFYELSGENPLLLGKTDISADGSFTLNLEKPVGAGIYGLRIGQKQILLILDGKEKKINLTADLATLKTTEYEVTGSPSTTLYLNTFKEIKSGSMSLDALKQRLATLDNPLVAMVISLNISELRTEDNIGFLGEIADKFLVQDPTSKYALDFNKMVTSYKKAYAMQAAKAEAIGIGKPAPDIALKDPYGKVLRLSDLKGKVVLLDFWASWCGPCRRANPSVVAAYNRFKDRGFTVFSVSLDKDGDKWVQAIKQDALIWPYHVSDLKFWDSEAAALYGVQGIPAQFLIDAKGIIRAMPQGEAALDAALEAMF